MNIKNRHMSKKLDIISVFLRDYSASYSGREIARLVKVSPQTGLSILRMLVNEKVLLIKKEGRNNKYGLNKKDLRTKMILCLAETNKARIFLEKKELKLILDKLLPLAETLVIFGSFAKNLEKKSSDLDLIAMGVKDKNKFRKFKNIFPKEINVEYAAWNTFNNVKNALSVEIKKDHLIYGNVFKVVEVYCQ